MSVNLIRDCKIRREMRNVAVQGGSPPIKGDQGEMYGWVYYAVIYKVIKCFGTVFIFFQKKNKWLNDLKEK